MYSADKENTLLSLDDDKDKTDKAEKSSWSISVPSSEGSNSLIY